MIDTSEWFGGKSVRVRFLSIQAFGKFGTPFGYLATIDGDRRWCRNPDADAAAPDRHDGDMNVAVDDDLFAHAPCQDQHDRSSVKLKAG